MSRNHFKHDLEPYVCISDECGSNLQYFVSLRDWRQHMNSQHTLDWIEDIHRPATWFCETGDHDYQEFATEAELRDHLQAAHSEFNSEQQDTVVERNVVYTSRGHDTCPLCGTDVARLLQNAPPSDPASSPIKPEPLAEPSSSSMKFAKKLRFDTQADPANSDEEDYHEASDSLIDTSDAAGPTAEDVQWRTNQIRLSTHVAGHLKSLAFTSLRYFDDCNDDSALQGSKRAASGDAGEKLSSEGGHGDHYFELDELNQTSFQDIPRDQRNDEVEHPPPDPATTAFWAASRTKGGTSFASIYAEDQGSMSGDPVSQDYPSVSDTKSNLSLSTRINQNITQSAFPRNSKALFIPRILLDSITQDAIIQHLNPQRLDGSFIGYIAQHLRELFAIFIAIAMPTNVIIEFIVMLQQQGVTDNHIPQIYEVMARFPQLNAVWKGHVNGHRYIFRAPVFSQQLRSQMIHIHHEIPLPVYFCHKTSWTGGFGTVYQVKIHRMFEERSPDEVRLSCIN